MLHAPRALPLMLTVILSTCGACRASEDVASAGRPRAALVAWTQLALTSHSVVKARTDAKYVASHDRSGRLRVWQLGGDYALTGPLLDTDESDCVAQDFEWVGDELLYVATRKLPPEIAAVERDSDVISLWPADFVAANSRLVRWTPDSRIETILGTTGYSVLLAHPREPSVLALGPFIDAHEGRFDGMRAHVVDVAGGAVTDALRLSGANEVAGTAVRIGVPWCVCRDPETGALYIVDNPEAEEGGETGHPAHALRYLKLDGTFLTLSSQRRIRVIHQPDAREIPLPAGVLGGQMVASLAQDGVEGRHGMAVYDTEGLHKWYPFSARWRCPVGLKQHGTSWTFICPGLDGHSAVFQSGGRAPAANDAQSLYEVWLWDLETDTGMLLCQIAPIERCFGWIHDHALMIGTQARDEDGKRAGTDYGVIHWAPDEG